ncbi:MAG: hypothetical protein SWX82_30340 [Cyanobacteriota bacterium]|nr:hypothetical protein [Cyanobacteriota bacterium]
MSLVFIEILIEEARTGNLVTFPTDIIPLLYHRWQLDLTKEI